MSFISSSIKGVGTDSDSGQIMSQKRYNSKLPSGFPRVQMKLPLGGNVGNVDVMGGGANPNIRSFKKGGTVPKTGVYKLHKDEEVLNKKKAMAYRMKK